MNNEVEQKNDVLFRGRDVRVEIDGTSDGVSVQVDTVRVNQLKLSQYEAAFAQLDNEFNLVSLACARPQGWAQTLTPESYEAVYALVQEVNAKGFFVYAERRQATLVRRLNSVTPQLLKAASEASTSQTSSQRLRPRPA